MTSARLWLAAAAIDRIEHHLDAFATEQAWWLDDYALFRGQATGFRHQ